jgi:hypothetical protein
MDPTIITAGIMAGGTICTQVIIATVNKKSTTEIINYRVDELEKKVMKHNNLVERMTKCESSIKSAHHRIDEIKEAK